MKKLLSAIVVAAAACAPFAAHATTIKFNSGLDPFFSYSGVSVLNFSIPNSGYSNMQNYTGDTGVAYNPNEVSPSTFTATSNFDLNSFLIDGAWGTQTLTINGLLNGTTLYTEHVGVNLTPKLVTLNWSTINEFMISTGNDFVQEPNVSGSGHHWVLDNVVVNENGATVPEPTTVALFGLGMLGFVTSRRKNARQ